MKTLAQAVKKISLDKSLSPDQILFNKKSHNTYMILDTANRDTYILHAGMLAHCQFDQDVLTETFDQGIFGDVSKLIDEIYETKFGGRKLLDLFKSVNDKMDVNGFKNELKNLLSQKYPSMTNEIQVFVENNGKELFRKFRVKFVNDKGKLEGDLGQGKGKGGKGKSKDSKGIFLSMPPRPMAGGSKKVMVKKSGIDYVDLSSSPIQEPGVQVSKYVDYREDMINECKDFARQLMEIFPWHNEVGIDFVIKANPHDFGTYYEVNARFSDADEMSYDYAYWMQDHLPLTWDDRSPREKPDFGDAPQIDNSIDENFV